MSKFTVGVPLRMDWRGLTIDGAAGATHRIPDALYDEFNADFVTGKGSTVMPDLAWISIDEQTAVGGAHPDLATHDTLGLSTQVEFDGHTAAADPHTGYALDADLTNHEGAADPHVVYQRESEKAAASGYASLDASTKVPIAQLPTGTTAITVALGDAAAALDATHAAAADPHTGYLKESDFDDIDFLVGTATGFTAAEIVVGTAPGGELGGTWASPTVDATHSGSAHHTQAHSIISADHATTGLTTGQLMQATSTAAFGFAALTISRGGTLIQASGLTAAVNIIVWRAPFACTVTAVKGYRVGGTGATVNARRNGSSNHLASAVSVASADAWTDGGAVQNTAYAAGDKLEIMIVTVTGSPTQVAVQVDFTRP